MKPLSEPFSTGLYYFETDCQMLLICLYCAEQLSIYLSFLLTYFNYLLTYLLPYLLTYLTYLLS